MRTALSGVALLGAFAISLVAVLTFTRPPINIVATGNPGTGMQLNYVPNQVAAALAINKAPAALPPIDAGPPASTVYKNVQVLGNVSSGAFTRLMVSMTNWVAPQQGCNYCHVAGNFADDSKYTKVIARRMLQMTIAVNTKYTNHVGSVGVTCYTCHRGAPVPSQVWFTGVTPGSGAGLLETNMGKNLPALAINNSSLPSDPFTPFLLNNEKIRDQGTTALPSGNTQSIKQTDWTYALMMHYSQALGVNCAFCHNSQAFSDWSESTPQRLTAFYAEAMLRDLNANYMVPLTSTFPASQRGPMGDVAKINCATCHQGVYKPLFGAAMAAQFPPLLGVGATATAAATPMVMPSTMPMSSPPTTDGAKP